MIEYDKDAICYPYITEFLRSEVNRHDGVLKELEEYAKENSVPIVQPETAQLLEVLAAMKRPARILEIGCAIGYSALLMAQYLADNGTVTTIEWDADMAVRARENIKRAGYEDKINVIHNDAKEVIPTLTAEYDIIFLDGPKAHYIYMLDDCVRLLRKGGLLVADNVLYKGMTTTDDLVIRRKITIVRRLRQFITELNSRTDLKTSILPLGDGMTISIKL